VDPQLAPLGDNGGPSQTHALLGGSPALDAANPAGCTDAQGQTLTIDQRSSGRTVDGDGDGTARCDVGAFELASGLTISSIQPREGGNGGSLIAVVHGSGFQSGATVKLVRNGQADIEGTPASIGEGGQIALTTFDLAGKALGAWDVVVTNPDATTATSGGVFEVATPRAPDLWIDIIGRHVARAGRPARYLLLYGNRGNTDAFAVPLLFGAAESLTVTPRFEIAPPPKQYGKIVILEWGGFYREIIVGDGPPLRQLMLLIPVVPAGFTGALDLLVEVPEAAAGQQVAIRLEQADPLFDRAPKPEAVAKLVQGARDKSERLFHYTIPTAIDADLTEYMTTQLDTIVADGVASLVTSFGSAPKVYSLTQLGYDLAAFGLVWAEVNTPLAVSSLDAPPPGLGILGFAAGLASRVADFCAAPARAGDLTCVCGEGPRGLSCCGGCSCPRDEQKEPEKPSKPCILEPDGPDCQRPKTPSECKDIGFVVVSGKDNYEKKLSICTNKPSCLITNTVGGTSCIKFPLDPVASADPNDKSGPIGAGAAGFITTDIPLRYVVEFENVEAATAPAAEVVVTDPLDPNLVDLTTLSLGPIPFGDHEIVPPPGLTEFTRDVDLRPDTNLIVRIDAKLDAATALLTWRLTSLDPATMQPPETRSPASSRPTGTHPRGAATSCSPSRQNPG